MQETRSMPLVKQITTPAELRKLSMDELVTLAQHLRERIFRAVSTNGGHLASNLGVVELTIALHYVYDFGPHPAGPDCCCGMSVISAMRTRC
jgi:1-deoxy-D-xylulose-5-phosphate synthase